MCKHYIVKCKPGKSQWVTLRGVGQENVNREGGLTCGVFTRKESMGYLSGYMPGKGQWVTFWGVGQESVNKLRIIVSLVYWLLPVLTLEHFSA